MFRPVERRRVRICWLAGSPFFAFFVSALFAIDVVDNFFDFALVALVAVFAAGASFSDVALLGSTIDGAFSVSVVAGGESGSFALPAGST